MASHYSDDLALGSRINYHTIGMTMDESNDVSGGSNVSIATYLSTIKNTFNTFVSVFLVLIESFEIISISSNSLNCSGSP